MITSTQNFSLNGSAFSCLRDITSLDLVNLYNELVSIDLVLFLELHALPEELECLNINLMYILSLIGDMLFYCS